MPCGKNPMSYSKRCFAETIFFATRPLLIILSFQTSKSSCNPSNVLCVMCDWNRAFSHDATHNLLNKYGSANAILLKCSVPPSAEYFLALFIIKGDIIKRNS